MIAATGFEKRNVAVLGLGKSGLATVRSLEAGGARVFAWDDAPAKRYEAAKEGFLLADSSAWDWGSLSAMILSPGIPFTHPEPHPAVKQAQAAGVEVIGDIELFQRAVKASGKPARIVAITGTNGKSTTTALIGHMVRRCGGNAQVGGNIGKAVLELDEPEASTIYVVEVSSYQIDLAPSLAPNVAVLLNITPDHIDRHGTVEHYAEVKARIFARQGEADTAIVGIDDGRTSEICTREVAKRMEKVVPISVGKTISRGIYALGGQLYDSLGTQTVKAGDL
ncbi:MAG: UDP-N-acetylmuramoyl-L-alanine--D-glutamate ligase, partial [Alphaproteobacteria bacterium]|nr:UDP-N-acetylmuramoyl-L-alanine--D-glutamate ligase [Alphaproteobacteria bacterium]MDX5415099.1 UDP-N-acetylmuramoyl-L-alanine--D-glutamate ligase [Alphaproteobacteria bacterium]MDX5492290.1 UDP-N-acetylmuramoyl-L-alanine--D-glutamate ligase [Alphaproteobacteria bacterium]